MNFSLLVLEVQQVGCRLDDGIGQPGADGCWRWWLFLTLTVLLCWEALLKSIALGVVHPKQAYARTCAAQVGCVTAHLLVIAMEWPDGSATSYCDATGGAAAAHHQDTVLDLLLRVARITNLMRVLRHIRVLSFIFSALTKAMPLVFRTLVSVGLQS